MSGPDGPFENVTRGVGQHLLQVYLAYPTNGRPAGVLGFAVCPLSLFSGKVFGTARSGQGRAVLARRSEPLTARTVPERGAGGKGGRVAGAKPPRGAGRASERT